MQSSNQYLVEGEILKILEKESKFGDSYFDVLFRLESNSVYRSCIYPHCRNFSNWTGLLRIGNILGNLELIEKFGKVFVDADSKPHLLRKGNPNVKEDLKAIAKPTMRKVFQGSLF